MKISFSKEEILKGGNVRVEDSRYYNSRLSDKSKESCIGFMQENSIEFMIQYIYLIYIRLIVHTT